MSTTDTPRFLDLIENTAPSDERDRFGYYLETEDTPTRTARPGVWFLVTDGGFYQCTGEGVVNQWHIPVDRAVNHGPVWELVKESPLARQEGA